MNPPGRGLPILTPLVLVLIAVEAIADLFVLGATVFLHVAETAPGATEESVMPAALVLVGTGLLDLLVICVDGVVFLVWTYWAAKNVRALGAQGLSITPGWAVGWYFVPFANLIMPHNALQEIAKASVSPRAWTQVSTWTLIVVWWVLRLVVSVGQAILGRLALEEDFDALTPELSLGLDVGFTVGGLVVLGLAAWMVSAIDSAQKAAYDTGDWRNVAPLSPPGFGQLPPGVGQNPYTVVGDKSNPYRSPGV